MQALHCSRAGAERAQQAKPHAGLCYPALPHPYPPCPATGAPGWARTREWKAATVCGSSVIFMRCASARPASAPAPRQPAAPPRACCTVREQQTGHPLAWGLAGAARALGRAQVTGTRQQPAGCVQRTPASRAGQERAGRGRGARRRSARAARGRRPWRPGRRPRRRRRPAGRACCPGARSSARTGSRSRRCTGPSWPGTPSWWSRGSLRAHARGRTCVLSPAPRPLDSGRLLMLCSLTPLQMSVTQKIQC